MAGERWLRRRRGNGSAQVTGKPVEQLFKGGAVAGADANMSS